MRCDGGQSQRDHSGQSIQKYHLAGRDRHWIDWNHDLRYIVIHCHNTNSQATLYMVRGQL